MNELIQLNKTCSYCKKSKELSNFNRRGGENKHKNKLISKCKECIKFIYYPKRKKYPDKRREKYKKDPLYYLWYIAKKRAKKKNIRFNIQPEDIIFTGWCPITGEKLDVLTNKLRNSISLDRKDNTKGYEKGNVFAISRWANLRKSDMSIHDLLNIIEYMEKKCPQKSI
jgi:hypothetical protein